MLCREGAVSRVPISSIPFILVWGGFILGKGGKGKGGKGREGKVGIKSEGEGDDTNELDNAPSS